MKLKPSLSLNCITRSSFFPIAEIGKLRQTIEGESNKFERTRDDLEERLAKTENELQMALQNEKTAHEEDVERLSREKVRAERDCDVIIFLV